MAGIIPPPAGMMGSRHKQFAFFRRFFCFNGKTSAVQMFTCACADAENVLNEGTIAACVFCVQVYRLMQRHGS